MQSLSIRATTRASAEGFLTSLAGFDARLSEGEGERYSVEIALGRGDAEIINVLNALENYVSHRADGPAELDLGGQTYTLHPTD